MNDPHHRRSASGRQIALARMTSPTVWTRLWYERAALHGAVSAPLIHTGRLRPQQMAAAGPLLSAGLTAALTDELRSGDLIVADELRTSAGVMGSRAGPLVYGAVRRLGLRAHLGPVLSLTHGANDGTGVAVTCGAIAVDTESADLAGLPSVGQTVVLRAVVGTPAAPLGSTSTPWRGLAALRMLRAAAPAMNQWAAATGQREILLAGPRSFCAGVERAVQIVQRALQRFGAPIYVRRQIVHNTHVVHELQSRGAVFVDELDMVPAGNTVVLAAHGVAPAIRREAKARGLQVIDATCPLVEKVHSEVRRYAARGNTVFLIGHGEHEEVVGTRGEAPERVVVVTDPTQAATVQPADPTNVAYVMQTTLAADEAEHTASVLRERFPAIATPRNGDICYATTNRQAAVREIAQRCELVLVLGSQNSSNSHRLAEVAEKCGPPAYLVEDVSAVDLRWLAGARRIGITAGASAPPHLVDELVECLSGLGPITVSDVDVINESTRFALPRQVT
jgi:4-hydroxy-3-methylbut-2-en-1-yl diphosphate reductase